MANCFSSDLPEISGCWEHSAATVVNMDIPLPAAADQATPFHFNGYPPFSFRPPPWSFPFEGFAEGRGTAASASRSHSEAEKRRRDRINAQLSTLRRLIPKSEKMDKAALLGSAVEILRDMKSKAMEISQVMMIPTDVDEVAVDEYPSCLNSKDDVNDIRLLKASICCDDRTELFSELNRTLKSLRLTVVHAEMISLGGRIKSIFVLCGGEEGAVCMNTVKQSLRVALSRIVTSCSNSGANYRIKSRRQRIFLSSDH